MSHGLIMLLEDQPLISLDLEGALRDSGFDDVVTMRSREEALSWLKMETPAAVILDLYLSDGHCFEVAELLSGRSVPFVVYSGSEKPAEWGRSYLADAQWIDKPADAHQVAAALISRVGSSDHRQRS